MPCGERRTTASAGYKSIEISGDADPASRNGAAEASHKRRPPCQEAGEAAECLAQVHVLATSFGLSGGELRVGQRAGKCECAAEQPHAENSGTVRHQRRDETRRDEDADADDVGDDDGGRVERAETSVEGGSCRADHRLSTVPHLNGRLTGQSPQGFFGGPEAYRCGKSSEERD